MRTPDGERTLRAGDLIAFPRGLAGGHQVTGPGTVLLLSEKHLPDVDRVPRQRQGGRAAPRRGQNFLAADAVGYWEGE